MPPHPGPLPRVGEGGKKPVEGGGHFSICADMEILALPYPPLLRRRQPRQITRCRATQHPRQEVRDAMAVLVRGALKGFGGGNLRARLEVVDLLARQCRIKRIRPMHPHVRLRRVPITLGLRLKLYVRGRREEFVTVMGIVKLRRRGGEDELELWVRRDDRRQRVHQFTEIADESDFIQQHRAGP
jgi:hypothetical protein